MSDDSSVDWEALEKQVGESDDPNVPLGTHVTLISPEMMAKRLLWGVVPCTDAVQVAEMMGLSPASPEVEEMEHEESHARLEAIAILAPFLSQMAPQATEAVTASMILATEHEVPEEVRRDSVEKLSPVVFHTAYALIAELVDVGILHLPHNFFITEPVE